MLISPEINFDVLLKFPIIVLFGFLMFLFLTILSPRRSIYRLVCGNLCLLFFLVSSMEVGSLILMEASDDHTQWAGDYREGYFIDNEILGYAPSKGRKVNSRKYVRGELVYDVTYTINDQGLRSTPQYEWQRGDLGIVFFGGSNTFGEGLDDDETLPFLVGEVSEHNVYNFAFHGYGPHQMLSAIQHRLVDGIVRHDRIVIIDPTHHSHVARIAGLAS